MDQRLKELRHHLDTILAVSPVSLNGATVKTFPRKPGVYRIFENDSGWSNSVYIGQSSDLSRRIYKNHLTGGARYSTLVKKLLERNHFDTTEAVQRFLTDRCSVQYIEIPDSKIRTVVEHYLVSVLRPLHND